ncbi:MAG: hypothetical protein AB7N53_17795 [Candidatus Binatia bacterium]
MRPDERVKPDNRELVWLLARFASVPPPPKGALTEHWASASGLDLIAPTERRTVESLFLKLLRQYGLSGKRESPVCQHLIEQGLPMLVIESRHLIRRVLAGKRACLINQSQLSIAFFLEGGRLREDVSGPNHWVLGSLLTAVRIVPFPFGVCPSCNRVFPKVKRQRFCKRACADKAFEHGRKAAKREYMREYMAQRRAKQRRAAAGQKG